MKTNSQQTEKTQPRSRTAAWLILAVLLLFSIAAPLNQFKVPPIMPVLMDALGLSVDGAGLLMSVFAVTGLILALPSGLILQRAGARVTGILAGGSILLGSALGELSTSTGALLTSRVIEGIGTSFMAVLAPAIIAQCSLPAGAARRWASGQRGYPLAPPPCCWARRRWGRRPAGARYGGSAPAMPWWSQSYTHTSSAVLDGTPGQTVASCIILKS